MIDQSTQYQIMDDLKALREMMGSLVGQVAVIDAKCDIAIDAANNAMAEAMQKPSFSDLTREIDSNVPEEIRGASIAGFGDVLIKDGASASWGYVPEGDGGGSTENAFDGVFYYKGEKKTAGDYSKAYVVYNANNGSITAIDAMPDSWGDNQFYLEVATCGKNPRILC